MKTRNLPSTSKRKRYRFLFSLGIGISSMAVGAPVHASIPPESCSAPQAATTANFSTIQVSKELEYLRRLDLHENLGFATKNLLIQTACSATCSADGGGTYTQTPGCTYTQTCGGRPTVQG
jgi:hypothetical protein